MNNLTTRKIVLGLLMALVLAFSVQGIAEALTFSTSRTGDVETVVHDQEDIDVSFSVRLDSSRPKESTYKKRSTSNPHYDEDAPYYDTDNPVDTWETLENLNTGLGNGLRYKRVGNDYIYFTVEKVEDDTNSDGDFNEPGETTYTYTYRTSQGSGGGTDGNFDVNRFERGSLVTAVHNSANVMSEDEAHYYNQEAIQIAVTGTASTNPMIKQVKTYRIDPMDSHTMREQEKDTDSEKLTSGTIRLIISVDGPGTVTIKVTDATPNETTEEPFDNNEVDTGDVPNGRQFPPVTLTVYAVNETARGETLARPSTNEYQFGRDGPVQIDGFFTVTDDLPLNYTVEGSGSIYVKVDYTDGSPTSEGRPAKTLFTSSSAEVFLNMNRGSSKVNLYIQGESPLETTKSITFIYDYAVLEITGGDNQVGATSGRLEDPLVVKVTDKNRRPVPGLRVQFDNPNSRVTDDSFIPFPDTTVYTTTDSRTLATTQADETRVATSSSPEPSAGGALIYVQTDSSGEAKVYYQLGSNEAETQDVQVMAAGVTKTFTLDADDDARRASLQMVLHGEGYRIRERRDLLPDSYRAKCGWT